MSKLVLWFGFILSICLLSFGFLTGSGKPLVFLFWIVILLSTGYKLFIAKPSKT